MSLRKEDIWADLRYALDELNRPLEKMGLYDRLPPTGLFSPVYSKAKMRADTRTAHEAIEKGLKAILIDRGLTEKHMPFSRAPATPAIDGCSETQPDRIQ